MTEPKYTRAQMDRLLRPRSIALVGASPTPGSFGASVLANLDAANYSGTLYLINPKRTEITGRPCLASVDALPEGVDCAVLMIPRDSVLATIEACARHSVGAVIVFSAGFAESGEAGRLEQEAMHHIATTSGMLIEGPNCLGLVNYIDAIPLTFVVSPIQKLTTPNGIAIVSQSGAIAAVLGVSLRSRALGISFSVSTGNEAAAGVEDFVAYMLDDPNTRVIAMIVEHFRHPRRFLEVARLARAANKRIVLLHPGSSSAARAAAATHTGAMVGDYNIMRTLVAHAGVLLVDTLEELIDVADILIRCPALPTGGAAVFTESGAFKALTLDLCESLSLPLPTLSEATSAALRAVLPAFIPPTNPLDITAQGLVDPDLYRRTLPPVLDDPTYGSVVLAIILTDPTTSGLKLPPILEALKEIKPTKPVLFAAMDEGAPIDQHYIDQLRTLGVPFFPSPERAFRALARITAYTANLPPEATSTQQLPAAQTLSSGIIPEYKSKEIFAAIGIPIPPGAMARTLDEAHTIATRIGYPVVLKAQSSALSHKSDFGGIALNLPDANALTAAWHCMNATLTAALPNLVLDGVLVETMGQRAAELIIGAQNHPDWGPVLLIGFGGIFAEALHDIRLIPPDLSHEAILYQLHQLKGAAILKGFRSSPALDIDAVAVIVHRLGQLMLANPTIREVDINPVLVYPKGSGAVALDGLIVVE